MTTIILTDTINEFTLCVTSVNDLYDMAIDAYPYFYGKFNISYNDVVLDKNKPLKFYNIDDNDILLIHDKHNQDEIEEIDMLRYTLLHVLVTIDNYDVSVIIDSGASLSVISSKYVETLGLANKINSNINYTMKGVGTAKCLGVIHNLTMKINNKILAQISLNVIDSNENIFLFGLDVLNKNSCIIDVCKKKLHWDNKILDMLNENDVIKYKNPIVNNNAQLLYIEQHYFNIINKLDDNNKLKFSETVQKIINNILVESNEKYLTLPKKAKIVNDIIINNNGTQFIESIGFTDNGDNFKFKNTDYKAFELLKNTLKIITTENVAMAS